MSWMGLVLFRGFVCLYFLTIVDVIKEAARPIVFKSSCAVGSDSARHASVRVQVIKNAEYRLLFSEKNKEEDPKNRR